MKTLLARPQFAALVALSLMAVATSTTPAAAAERAAEVAPTKPPSARVYEATSKHGTTNTAAAAKAPSPKARDYSYIYDFAQNSVFRQVARMADVPRTIRRIGDRPLEAANVDETDQVRLPSTWWQPRIGFREVTVEQMLNGPGTLDGPAPGKWTVTHAKARGVSSGFQIKDSRGKKYIIKFDPARFPECATGADVIGSLLFWAAGYNVPSNAIAYFHPDSLVIGKDATYRTQWGHDKPITPAYMKTLLAPLLRQRDGRYRCVASEFLSGKPLGAFHYQGVRKDDPEDKIPHEMRRELRGLWTVAAWLNHSDARGPNSLDMWVTENGRSFVRHHLIDFGSTLGSSALPDLRSYATGFEYYLDYGTLGREVATAGLAPFKWEDVVDPNIPAVGFIEAEHFDPATWRPDNPNPAFDDRTDRDARWGARIVAGFTDEHIRAAVAAAKYTDPRASQYMTQVLIQRRDKLVRRWLGTVYRPPYVVSR